VIALLARVLAASWVALNVTSLIAGVRYLIDHRSNPLGALTEFLDRVSPLSRWQRLASRILVLLLFRAFFTSSLNTDIWPWAVSAWVALTVQLLFLRAHLMGYVEIIERGFDRPVARYVAGNIALDLIILAPIIALTTIGFR